MVKLLVATRPGRFLVGPPREQELEQKAQATAIRRAGVQAVEACSTGQAATVQTGTANEDRNAEADGLIQQTNAKRHCLSHRRLHLTPRLLKTNYPPVHSSPETLCPNLE